MTDTPVIFPNPTVTPSPSSTPTLAYSYLPAISSANATAAIEFDKFNGWVNNIAFSPNGMYLAASFDNGAGIIWDISKPNYLGNWQPIQKDVFVAKGPLSFSADSNILASGGTLIDLASKVITQELPASLVAFSPDGKTLVSLDRRVVSFWNIDEDQWALVHKGEDHFAVNIVFSPDGSLLAEAIEWGGGEGVNIWRMMDRKLLYSFPPPEHGHGAHFNTQAEAFVTFSPDGQMVATGTKDQPVIRIWDLKTGELIKDLDTVVEINKQDESTGQTITAYYVPDVEAVAFSTDSKIIAISGGNTVIFKTISSGEFINELNIDPYNSFSPTYITAFAMSPDGRLLAIGDSSGNVRLWGVLALVP